MDDLRKIIQFNGKFGEESDESGRECGQNG